MIFGMVRAVSQADAALIAQLAEQGLRASPSQLERWRATGLLPKPLVTRLGNAGSSSSYPPSAAEIAAALARHSNRRRGPAELAVLLLLDGLPVSDEVLVSAVRELVEQFVADASKHGLATPAPGEDVLGEAETLAAKEVARGGEHVRRMRRNLRKHPLPQTTSDNRDAVLEGSLTTMFRLLLGELPEDDDSLRELLHALGSNGIFETAPGAHGPVADRDVGSLRCGLQMMSIDALTATAAAATAQQLRASAAFVVPLMRALGQLPAPLGYHLGQPDGVAFDANEAKAVAVLTVAWLPLWAVTPGSDPTAVLQTLAAVGTMTADEAATAIGAATFLQQNPIPLPD
jgi:hypothetical protein